MDSNELVHRIGLLNDEQRNLLLYMLAGRMANEDPDELTLLLMLAGWEVIDESREV